MNSSPALLLLALATGLFGSAASAAEGPVAQLARANLHAVVAHDHALPRFHAAEDLVILGETDPLYPIEADLPALATQPIYRIVLWRVQARQAAAAGRSPAPFTKKIVEVFFASPAAPDQINAAETLGKLRYLPSAAERERFLQLAPQDNILGLHSRWVAASTGQISDEKALAAFLQDKDWNLRGDAAYALRFRPYLRPETRDFFVRCAQQEPGDSLARISVVAAAMVHATPAQRAALLPIAEAALQTGTPDDKFEVMNVLALVGGPEELSRLRAFLRPAEPYVAADADLRVGASYAILSILRHHPDPKF